VKVYSGDGSVYQNGEPGAGGMVPYGRRQAAAGNVTAHVKNRSNMVTYPAVRYKRCGGM